MPEEIKASEVRKTFLEAWSKCEFGVKERVKERYTSRALHYILKTESYSNTDKVLEIMEAIKEESEKVKGKVIAMDDSIKNTLKKQT